MRGEWKAAGDPPLPPIRDTVTSLNRDDVQRHPGKVGIAEPRTADAFAVGALRRPAGL